jgi:hypothetical protein
VSQNGKAFRTWSRTSMHCRLLSPGGVRTLSDSNRTISQQLSFNIKECKNSEDFLQLLLQHGGNFNHINIVAAWIKFRSMPRGADGGARIDQILLLQALTESHVPEMDGRAVANILHGIAKTKAEVIAAGANSFRQHHSELQHFQSIVWRKLIQKLTAQATSVSESSGPVGVAITLWALATIGVRPEAGLLRAMQGRATAVAGEFNPQEVANTVWAHACLGIPCGKREQELFEILGSRLLEVTSKMEPKHECQVHQWLLTFELEPSWDLSSLAQVKIVKQEFGERYRRSFVLEDPTTSDLQVDLALMSRLTFSDRSIA